MKKYILTLIIIFMGILSINANNANTTKVIESQISEVIINVPSTIKVLPSEDNNTYLRFRSKNNYLLNTVYYKYNDNTLLLETSENIDNIKDNNIIIYLYTPNDNIKYITQNNDLIVSTKNNINKNINKSNHENQD